MKYLSIQTILLLASVIILYYFSTLTYFLPTAGDNSPNWYNIFAVIFVLFVLSQSIISLSVFFIEKIFTCGKKEMPHFSRSLKWGLGISFGLIIVLLMHIFHLLNLAWGLVIGLVILLGILFIR